MSYPCFQICSEKEAFGLSKRQSHIHVIDELVDGYLRIIEQLSVFLQEMSHETGKIVEINEQAQLLMSMPGIGSGGIRK